MTVVFLHGVAGSRASYAWLPGEIAGHAVVAPDFRGHGAAPRTPGAYLIDDYTADAIALLREVGPAFVVGHSLGGVVAWRAAQAVPQLVLGALLEDPPLFPADVSVPFTYLRALAVSFQTRGLDQAAAEAAVAAQPEGPSLTGAAISARASALLALDPAVLDPVIDGTLLTGVDTTPPERPVRILAADDAHGAAFTTAHEARLGVPVQRFLSAGHSIHDERAHRDAYFAAVTAFVS